MTPEEAARELLSVTEVLELSEIPIEFLHPLIVSVARRINELQKEIVADINDIHENYAHYRGFWGGGKVIDDWFV